MERDKSGPYAPGIASLAVVGDFASSILFEKTDAYVSRDAASRVIQRLANRLAD
jgi:hypothetical protein